MREIIVVNDKLYGFKEEQWSLGFSKVGFAGGGVTWFLDTEFEIETTSLCKVVKFRENTIYIFSNDRIAKFFCKKFLHNPEIYKSRDNFSIDTSPRKSAFVISNGKIYESMDHQTLVMNHDSIDVMGVRYPKITCLVDIERKIVEYSDSHLEYVVMENLSGINYEDILLSSGIRNYMVTSGAYLDKTESRYKLIDKI